MEPLASLVQMDTQAAFIIPVGQRLSEAQGKGGSRRLARVPG